MQGDVETRKLSFSVLLKIYIFVGVPIQWWWACFVVFAGNKTTDISTGAHSKTWRQRRHCVLVFPLTTLEACRWSTQLTQLHVGRKSVFQFSCYLLLSLLWKKNSIPLAVHLNEKSDDIANPVIE